MRARPSQPALPQDFARAMTNIPTIGPPTQRGNPALNLPFFRFARWLVRVYVSVAFSISVRGLEHLPPTGAVIVASNHITGWDPPILGAILPRPIHFMAKAELFRNKLLGRILLGVGAFPVKRGAGDISSIKQSLKILREGKVFGIFVEGTRSRSGELQAAKGGAAMFAVKTKSQVLPCLFKAGPKQWRRRIEIQFGPPIEADETWRDYDAGAAQIIAAIANLDPDRAQNAPTP